MMAGLLSRNISHLSKLISPHFQVLSFSRVGQVLPVRYCSSKVPRPESFGNRDKGSSFKDRKSPITWINVAATGIVIVSILGAYYYARTQKEKQRDANRRREIGKAKIGGSFDLIDHTGQPKKSSDFYGKWLLLYFGFTHCPDICPDEMEKMAAVYDGLVEEAKTTKIVGEVVPLFISVDPERDGVKEVAEYIKEFHPEMVGLTGSEEKVKEACKAFRVYYSAGPRDEEDDYIVDHTIIIYLIDPDGQFIDYYGQTKTVKEIKTSVLLQMTKWAQLNKKSFF